MAERPHAARGLTALAVLVASLVPAAAEEPPCTPAMPVIRSDRGLIFTADAYAWLEWRERSAGGRRLAYGAHVWRGAVQGRRAYLTFDAIPGTSGPNHHMDHRLRAYPVRPQWRRTGIRYDLGRWFVVRSGALEGEWTVANCS